MNEQESMKKGYNSGVFSPLVLLAFGIVGTLMLLWDTQLIFSARTEMEAVMGMIQKIFYFHVPSAAAGFLAFLVVFIASIVYLRNGSRVADIWAEAGAELGMMLTLLVLLTGMIWSRYSSWGVWWAWEPRQMTVLFLFLIFVTYVILRRSIHQPVKRGKFCAVLGIIGFLNTPLVYFSTKFGGLHPMLNSGDEGSSLTESMQSTFGISMLIITLFCAFLLLLRVRQGMLDDAVREKEASS